MILWRTANLNAYLYQKKTRFIKWVTRPHSMIDQQQ
jgi:hypothetical protein